MAPPASVSQSWRGRPRSRPRPTARRCWPRRRRSRPRAGARPTRVGHGRAVERARWVAPAGAVGAQGRVVGAHRRHRRGAPARSRRRRHPAASTCTSQPSGTRSLGLLGVGEERDGRLRVDEDEVLDPGQLRGGELGEVAEPLDRREARAPLEPGREGLARAAWPRSRRRPDSRRRRPGSRTALPPSSSAAGSPERRAFAAAIDDVVGDRRARGRRPRRRRLGALGPRHVGREDERRHLAGRAQRGRHRVGGVARDLGVAVRRAHPARDGARPCPRCRTAAARRTASGRWRGRRRCSRPACEARRALCRFAIPLPRPGPRCSRIAAGRSAIRPYPSAAPVATPSNSAEHAAHLRHRVERGTKCISDVPGLVKHVSTPLSTSVRISAWAPFMVASISRRSCRG